MDSSMGALHLEPSLVPSPHVTVVSGGHMVAKRHSPCRSFCPGELAHWAEKTGLRNCCSSVDWVTSVACGTLGTFFVGRHGRENKDVIVSVICRDEAGRNELLLYVDKELASLLERLPCSIRLVGKFSATDGDTACVMLVTDFRGTDNAESFIVRCLSNPAYCNGCRHTHRVGVPAPALRPGAVSEWQVADDTVSDSSGPRRLPALHSLHHTRPSCCLLPRKEELRPIGDYDVFLNNEIGRGMFGTIYYGKHRYEGYPVAVKELSGPAEKKQQLRNEAEVLQYLKEIHHPNVIDTFGGCTEWEEQGKFKMVLVLELCRGGDLKNFLSNHGPLSETQARHVMRQLVDCFCCLKEHGVMHRDLKPENILLTSSSIDEAVVKVADWGMAKVGNKCDVGDGGDAGALFRSALGTMAYMSPERLRRNVYDFQAEVWALGVILYELLFARHPFLHPDSTVRTSEGLLEAIARAEELDIIDDGAHCSFPISTDCTNSPQWDKRQGATTRRHLSHDCYHLLRQMVHADVRKRSTIEEVRKHSWFQCEALADGKAVGSLGAKALGGCEMMREKEETTAPASPTEVSPALVSAPFHVSLGPAEPENEVSVAVENVSSSCKGDDKSSTLYFCAGFSPSQKREMVLLALREYFHVLRFHAIEVERDPSRGLVLLAYASDLLRSAAKAALLEGLPAAADQGEVSSTFGAGTSSHIVPDELREMEMYIQETSKRLRRSVPISTTTSSFTPILSQFSMTSLSESETSGESPHVSHESSQFKLPTAQALLFGRAVSLISTAASEELLIGSHNALVSQVGQNFAGLEALRLRRQGNYESAMAILRLLLQQVLILLPPPPARSITADVNRSDTIQPLCISFVALEDEADICTVQTLLHMTEKYYHRFFTNS
ncbi:putative protein kinase [Trypanosoma vivax]|nr:putative protein kinase [Trypanosoma vivax]